MSSDNQPQGGDHEKALFGRTHRIGGEWVCSAFAKRQCSSNTRPAAIPSSGNRYGDQQLRASH